MLHKNNTFTDTQLLDILASSLTATAVYTGDDVVIQLANDAMLGFWGRSSAIIGMPLGEAVPELNGQPFIGWLQNVWRTGETLEDKGVAAELLINGRLQKSYFDFSYRAIKNPDGTMCCILHTAADVTAEMQARNDIEEAQDQYKLAIESAELGTWFIDAQTRAFNPSGRLKQQFGFYEDEEMTYAAALSQIDPAYRIMVNDAVEASITRGDDFKVEYPVTGYHDRATRWMRATGKLYRDEYGRPEHLSGVMIDITDQKEEIARQNDFIAMASHELKTPVTSIKGLAQVVELMLRKDGNFKMADMMFKLQNQVGRLVTLIGDLLDVTKLQAGKLQLEEEYFNFNDIVTDTVDEMQRTTNKHDIICNLNFGGQVFGDKERIRQVIINFVSNAIKYSPEADTIIINTSLNADNVELCVKDFGIGIDRQHINRVFEQFYRVTGSSEKRFKGLGLGLYISSTIIQRSGGKIWADSYLGQGSTFCFSLPVSHRLMA